MRATLLPLLLLALSSGMPAVAAEPDAIVSGFVTRHASPGWEERNEGVGLMWRRTDAVRVGGGFYRNSLGQGSYYAVTNIQAGGSTFRYGINVGLATGYAWPLAPVVVPELAFRTGGAEAALLLQPLRISGKQEAYVALQFRFSFGGSNK